MSSRIGRLSLGELALLVAALLTPGIVALLALTGEPWQMLDRPLYSGQIVAPDFVPSLGRGFVVSTVVALALALMVTAGLTRQAAEREFVATGALLVGVSVVVLAPLTHAFWLADAVDVGRLSNPTTRRNVIFDLFAMSGSEWSQAAPYVLLALYAIVAFVTVLGIVAFHAKEHR